ncbi:MFS general substrate transporter [Mycena albidolilacea]|uniref:MFS general substrate transporter n=1 Tax=Mycena albidolilacea TaxID=1033008 RepID=A0AAD7ACW8_9AGAR|nr:MFS general substrate transporter [Mycena albidolilacea]
MRRLPTRSPFVLIQAHRWIGSFQLMAPFLLGVVAGKLFDNGHFHAIQIFGGATFIFSQVVLADFDHSLLQVFLSQGVGMGIGLGFMFVPTASIPVHHFAKRRGLASGVILSEAAMGSTVFPIMLNHLIPKIGFGPAVRATGYIVLGCIFTGNALMRTRLPPRSQRPNAVAPNMKSFFTDAPYLWAILSNSHFCSVVIYIQIFAAQHSVGSGLAFYSIAIMNASSAFGRVAGNSLGDIYGPLNVHAACTVITGGIIWTVLGIHNAWSLVLVSVLYGIFADKRLAYLLIGVLTLFRRFARAGVGLALISITSLGSAPIQGALLGTRFTWINPVALSGVGFPFPTVLSLIGYSQCLMSSGVICLVIPSLLFVRRNPPR